jgi:hypothetical protein
MALNRLLQPCYRVIATTETTRTEFSLSDFWPEVFAWCDQQTPANEKHCCERLLLPYLQHHHFASISSKTLPCCLKRVDAWLEQHGSPYEGFEFELDTLHGLANGNAHGFVVVQEKDYHNIAYIIPGIERLEVTVIPPRFCDD